MVLYGSGTQSSSDFVPRCASSGCLHRSTCTPQVTRRRWRNNVCYLNGNGRYPRTESPSRSCWTVKWPRASCKSRGSVKLRKRTSRGIWALGVRATKTFRYSWEYCSLYRGLLSEVPEDAVEALLDANGHDIQYARSGAIMTGLSRRRGGQGAANTSVYMPEPRNSQSYRLIPVARSAGRPI
jgi:hypothetical protein